MLPRLTASILKDASVELSQVVIQNRQGAKVQILLSPSKPPPNSGTSFHFGCCVIRSPPPPPPLLLPLRVSGNKGRKQNDVGVLFTPIKTFHKRGRRRDDTTAAGGDVITWAGNKKKKSKGLLCPLFPLFPPPQFRVSPIKGLYCPSREDIMDALPHLGSNPMPKKKSIVRSCLVPPQRQQLEVPIAPQIDYSSTLDSWFHYRE